jgi:hypothetical protein
MMYCDAVFTRGTGLGNRLFPWARCKLFARDHGCPMLAPRWAHIRTGPFLNGGISYRDSLRKVLLWDNFVAGPDEVTGWRRRLVRARFARVEDGLVGNEVQPGNVIVTFRGDGRHFQDLSGHQDYLLDQLSLAAKPRWRRAADRYPRLPIVLNVRRGKDFREASHRTDFLRAGGLRTPLDWFIHALEGLRRTLGRDLDAYVISDGTPADLEPLLRLAPIHHLNLGSAIADLLLLSRACVVIGSGGSSFSAWASFLSQSPALTITGQSLQWFRVASGQGPFVGEWDEGSSLGPFCEAAAVSLRQHAILV